MKLLWPIKGIGKIPGIYISQWFGQNPQIYKPNFGMDGHNGIDIACPRRTPIYASHDGWIIESVEKDTGYGLRVQFYFEEDGFGWEVINGHFEKSAFPEIPYDRNRRDIPVKAGQLIGYADSSGFSTGDHDHIGLKQYKNGQLLNANNGYFGSIDPRPYLQGEPIMGQIKTQAKGAERRIVLAASTPEQWKALCAVYGKDPNVIEETV